MLECRTSKRKSELSTLSLGGILRWTCASGTAVGIERNSTVSGALSGCSLLQVDRMDDPDN